MEQLTGLKACHRKREYRGEQSLSPSFGFVTDHDSARAELLPGKEDRAANRAAFDHLLAHRQEIGEALGTRLQWYRGDSLQPDHVSILNEADWQQRANCQARWTKRFCDGLR